MSFFATSLAQFEDQLKTDETWVINFFATVKADIAIAEQDIIKALAWISAHGTEIATDIAGILTIVAAAGIGVPAPILIAANALNAANKAVQAALAAQQASRAAGGSDLAQVAAAGGAAYQSIKQAQVSTSQAQAHVAAGTP